MTTHGRDDDGSWVACPTCGEHLPIPVDVAPRNEEDWKWYWEHIVFPAASRARSECRYAELLRHG